MMITKNDLEVIVEIVNEEMKGKFYSWLEKVIE